MFWSGQYLNDRTYLWFSATEFHSKEFVEQQEIRIENSGLTNF
jgi:hypothetical protein